MIKINVKKILCVDMVLKFEAFLSDIHWISFQYVVIQGKLQIIYKQGISIISYARFDNNLFRFCKIKHRIF